MIDLDSDPTKVIEIVEIGKQLSDHPWFAHDVQHRQRRGQIFRDYSGDFRATLPALGVLNIMGLKSPQSAILSAVIFNALIIVFLIPLALRGVQYRPRSAAKILQKNVLVYGVGGSSSLYRH